MFRLVKRFEKDIRNFDRVLLREIFCRSGLPKSNRRLTGGDGAIRK